MNLKENERTIRESEWRPDGFPKKRPVSDWPALLERVAVAEDWAKRSKNEETADRLREFARHCLRFARPDGTTIFGDGSRTMNDALLAWSDLVGDDAIRTVLDRRRSAGRVKRKATIAPPPLPAFWPEALPAAILRPDWSETGDWIAIDQRAEASPALVELAGAGRPWIGPTWGEPAVGKARARAWSSDWRADLFEWGCSTESGGVVRTALLARGRGWGILAEESRPADPSSNVRLRLDLARNVSVRPARHSAGLILSSDRKRALVAPIGVDSASLSVENGRLTLDSRAGGPRVWLPLVFAWNPDLFSKPVRFQTLTVAENARVRPPEIARAVRIAWGNGESIVVYRSLARPARRTFLGHQTTARFLVGYFQADGRVEPIVQID